MTASRTRRSLHSSLQNAVQQSQRERMLAGVLDSVADLGYARTTVAHVIARAGVSRKTFYEHFRELEDCFVAAYEEGVRALHEAVDAASQASAGWPLEKRVVASLTAYLAALGSMSAATKAFVSAAIGSSRRVALARSDALHRWAAAWQRLCDDCSQEVAAAPTVDGLLALCGGIEELVRDAFIRPGPQRLQGDLLQALTRFSLVALRAKVGVV
jgi:AcrR family transcriptional regulator